MRVLIVEDDDAIATPLAKGLEREGLAVDRVETGADALDRSAAASFDVVLLDLGLPDRDGFDVCRELRARSDVPIIVVTARSEEVDRVVGLELGADDYIVKPFGLRELVARIRAVVRRRTPAVDRRRGGRQRRRDRNARTPPRPATPTARDTPTATDTNTPPRWWRSARSPSTAARAGSPSRATRSRSTPKEFDLLAFLADDAGAVRPRQELLENVWDPHWYGPTKTLDVHVASLAQEARRSRDWIETVRGVGFRLRARAE